MQKCLRAKLTLHAKVTLREKLTQCKSTFVEKRLRAYQIPTRILQFKLCYVTFVLIKTEIQFKILKYKENMFLKQN